MRTRTGKIARLPLAIREELNKRLHNGEPASKILPWLNERPEVQQILQADFEGLRVNDQNLSDWRKGGFQDWLKHNDRFYHTRLLAERSVELAKVAGGNLTEGAAAILAGQILEVLESLGDIRDLVVKSADSDADDRKDKITDAAEAIDNLSNAISKLRKGDHNKEVLRQNDERLAHAREELDLAREKFQRETAGIALKILADARAKQIETTVGTNEEKIELMGKHIFGELWKPRQPA